MPKAATQNKIYGFIIFFEDRTVVESHRSLQILIYYKPETIKY